MAKKTAPDAGQAAPAEGAAKPAAEPKAKPEKPADAKPDGKAEAAPKPAAPAEPVAKKKKKPGRAPNRGKKLRNQLKNVRQRVGKEGPAPLKKAVALLKQIKRAKFD